MIYKLPRVTIYFLLASISTYFLPTSPSLFVFSALSVVSAFRFLWSARCISFLASVWPFVFFLLPFFYADLGQVLSPNYKYNQLISLVLLYQSFVFLVEHDILSRSPLRLNSVNLYLYEKHYLAPVLIAGTLFLSLMITGKFQFTNYSTLNLLDYIAFVLKAVLPYVILLMLAMRSSIWLKTSFCLTCSFILLLTGSKGVVPLVIALPIFIHLLFFARIKASFLFIILGFVVFLVTLPISLSAKYSVSISDLTSVVSLDTLSPQSLFSFALARYNFASVYASSINFLNSMPNVVFDPLLHGFLPKIFFPDRIDLNNGMVIGRLLGYVGSEENAYMATTIFTDLLIGAPYLISAIALIVFFSFVLFLARFALAGNIYPPMDVRLLTYCLSISLVFNTESNFAFYVITFFKNILILYIFNRLHIRFFPRSSPVFNSIGGAQLL